MPVEQRAQHPRVQPEEGRAHHQEGARVGDRQRRAQRRRRHRRAARSRRIYVERGTVLRRFQARAKGRGNRIMQADLPHLHVDASATATGKTRNDHGTEDPSDRLPPRASTATGARAGSRTASNFSDDAERGHQGARVPEEEARARRGGQGDDRAAGEERAHHDPQRAARRGDRQEGRGHRDRCARELRKMLGVRGARQHRGDPQARDRRAAHRRLDRAAAREADHVPPRDEARDAERDAPRRAGHQDHERGAPERHRDRAHGVVSRRPRAAAHAARRHRLRLLRGEDDLRRDRHQGLGVQGRGAGAQRATPGRRRRRHRQPKRRRRRAASKTGAKNAATS